MQLTNPVEFVYICLGPTCSFDRCSDDSLSGFYYEKFTIAYLVRLIFISHAKGFLQIQVYIF